jgi:hypothetical protein
VEAQWLEGLGAPDVVVEVRVAAIDDDVVPVQVAGNRVDHVLRGGAGGHHDPDGARACEPGDEVGDRGRAHRAVTLRLPDLLRATVVHDDAVAALHEADDHVHAHAAEADESELHRSVLR